MRTTKQLFTLFLFASLLFFISCKKTDTISVTENLSTNSIVEKFFNSHRTADPTEKVLIDFLKRVNEKDKFLEKTVAKIGYPRWDKAITNAKKKVALNARNLLGDSTQTFYIPFVRDSQNYVNAAMVIKISPTDTTFTYRCDWQYAQFVNDSTTADVQAKNVASFFMTLDKAVFEHSEFKITDKRLFKPISNTNVNDTTDYIIKKVILVDSSNSINSNNLLVFECTDITIFYECSFCHGNDPDCPLGGTWYENYHYCDWTYYPDPDNGGGSTSPGGGGNPVGGSTPPDCGTIPIDPLTMGRIVDPCNEGPGWTPEPIEDEPIEPLFSYSHLDNPIFVADDPVEMPVGFQFGFSNFDINTSTPIRVIGKTEPRGNTEDMQHGTNCDASGILSNMPNFTDAQLFAEVEDLFHKTSTGALETVGDIMIDRFRNNFGGQFTNATLSQAVFDNSKFQNFIVKFGKELHMALAANNWDINQVPPITMPQADRPAFNGLHNKFHGLQILINDTEETIIELKDFSINAITHKWTADLNITIKDHFGLDKNDALTYQNSHAGFAAWWILQHCRGYKPFETKISFKMQLQTQ